mgnify:CR=1 FL=1
MSFDLPLRFFIKIFLFLVFIVFLWEIREIILIFLTAIILAAGLEVWAKYIQQKLKINYSLSVILIFFLLIFLVSIVFYFLLPIVLNEFKNALPNIFNLDKKELIDYPFVKDIIENFQNEANFYLANISKATFKILGGIGKIVLIIAISFYLAFQGRNFFENFLNYFLPNYWVRRILILWEISQVKFAQWISAEIILMTVVGILTFIGLSLIGTPYVGFLAIISGMLEIIPFIGPIITAILSGIFGLTVNLKTGILSVIVIILIQQLENHLLVPTIMKAKINLNPVAVILSLIIGGKIGGFIGVLIAVPFTSALIEILGYLKRQNFSFQDILKDEKG